MNEWLKLVTLVGLGGAGVTLLAVAGARLMTEAQRIGRTFRQGLQTSPDASIVAHGSGRGVALSLASRRVVTVWDTGRWHMIYPLEELLGAELDLDGHVAARAMRGEPRRMLDKSSGAEREVRLRLLFDEPRHPDFELVLWPCKAGRDAPARPRDAIAEANRWIARIETLLRRTGGALTLAQPAAISKPAQAEHGDLADAIEDEDTYVD